MTTKQHKTEEVVIELPDLGLSDDEVHALKKAFENQVVSSMGSKAAAAARIVIVRIRVIYTREF